MIEIGDNLMFTIVAVVTVIGIVISECVRRK